MAGEPSARPTNRMLSAWEMHVCVHGELTLVSFDLLAKCASSKKIQVYEYKDDVGVRKKLELTWTLSGGASSHKVVFSSFENKREKKME
jgi:hypothetical protein